MGTVSVVQKAVKSRTMQAKEAGVTHLGFLVTVIPEHPFLDKGTIQISLSGVSL